ncbi:MAG: carboxypeptidase-like regulatory domain-containing protein [Pirellulaceae bacterium]
MNRARKTCWMAVYLATLNWILPLSQLRAWEPPRLTPASRTLDQPVRTVDIALGTSGELRGQVLDVQGRPATASRIVVLQDGRPVATVSSNAQGAFQTRGLHGGLFQVAVGNQVYACRGWAAGTAPPAAVDQLLVVPSGKVERGQRPLSDIFLSDPVLVGLFVAAAIAIPVAIYNSKSGRQPGS